MMFASADPRSFVRLPPDPRLGWVPYVWLGFLAGLFVEPVLGRASAGVWLATIAALIAFVPLYFRSFWLRGTELIPIAALTAAIGVALSTVNFGATVLFVYAASMLARQSETQRAVLGVIAVTAVAAATAVLVGGNNFVWITAVVTTPFIGGVSIHDTQVALRDAKLRLAQAEVERLAAVAERERIARDLHDVLGHTLTLIVRKAELAAKLAERDLPSARTEVLELEAISRAALSDVREAISGYRATWDDEIARAQRLLASSGTQLDVDGRPTFQSRAAEEALAFALREAVTNAARHAKATRVEVRWEARGAEALLRVRDNGSYSASPEGNGLRGLRERVEAIGGRLTFGRRADAAGSELCITVPEPSR